MNGTVGKEEPYPAPTNSITGLINGVETEVTSISFSDKLLVTITQDGRLAQWIQVPLSAPSPALLDVGMAPAGLSLPSSHLTPTTLLGGGNEDRETMGHLYAAHIASQWALRNPEDRRTLVLGLGLRQASGARESFFDFLELIQKVL